MDVVIRPAAPSDVDAVVALVRATLAEFGLTFGVGSGTDDALYHLPASYEEAGGRFWVAARDGALLGTCGVAPIAPGIYELRKMYLSPDARGLGLGRRLLDEAVAFARGAGGKRLVLDTVEAMGRAITFYEAHGFVRDDSVIRGARCTRGYAREL